MVGWFFGSIQEGVYGVLYTRAAQTVPRYYACCEARVWGKTVRMPCN